MGKTRRTLLAVLAIAILGGIFWPLTFPHEPAYAGKSLSSWLAEYNYRSLGWPRTFHAPADEAVRTLGTNAFPMIAERLRYQDSASKLKLIQFLQNHLALHLPFRIKTQDEYNLQAIAALCALGQDAKPLIPVLAESLDHIDFGISGTAQGWLMNLGSDGEAAIPALIQLLKDKRREMRYLAVAALAAVGANQTKLVLPALDERLQDSDNFVRKRAADAVNALSVLQNAPKEFWRQSEDD